MKVLVGLFTEERITVIRSVTEMLIGLHKKGVELEIVTNPNTFYNKRFKSAGIPVYEFFPTKKIDFKAISSLRKVLKNGNYDIFQTFENKWMATGNFACMGIDVIHVGYKGIGFQWYDPTYMLTMNTPLMDYLICLSDTVENNIKPQLFFQKPRTHKIYKGQDIAWFDQIKEKVDLKDYNVPEGAFVVSNISVVRPVKGVDILLDAWNYLPEDLPIHLVLIGDRTDSSVFQTQKASMKNGDRIHLLGKKENVVPFLREVDMYVLPTRGLEGLSRALMEAMSVGLPVVVSKSGGPEELVEHGISGEHVPKEDPKAIADAILDYYHNPEKRKRYGQAARNRIEEGEFSIQAYINNMYEFYKKILKDKL